MLLRAIKLDLLQCLIVLINLLIYVSEFVLNRLYSFEEEVRVVDQVLLSFKVS